MSLYVLDTDIVSLLHQVHPQVDHRVKAQDPKDLAVTVITVEEQISGWYRRLRRALKSDELSRTYQSLADTVVFLARFPILSLTLPAIARYDQLLRMKLGIRKMDLRIAAITLENGATLVTRNLRDFQRVPNLNLEDWSV